MLDEQHINARGCCVSGHADKASAAQLVRARAGGEGKLLNIVAVLSIVAEVEQA